MIESIKQPGEDKKSESADQIRAEQSPGRSNGRNGEKITVEDLRDEIALGFLCSHSRANANTSKVLEIASFSYALMELLMERGIITVTELDERKKIVGQRLVDKLSGREWESL